MPSSVINHTIPPFYACYFLRSLASPSTTYIGSTPAPPRRKRQHNGDLTQGAWKTARARPWEMECIVYGFSSKIAALQFEWAWAKPNLSRHLKVLATGGSDEGAGLPLFPSTSLTPGQTRWGKPKKRRPKTPSSPNSRILVMRALLRSEPFSGWGLKLAFFTEWSWLAYQRLEQQSQAADQNEAVAGSMILSENPPTIHRTSRSGKPLHPLYPLVVCDFKGVDGKRQALVEISQKYQQDAGVSAEPVKKRPSKKKVSAAESDPPGWPEHLPKSANLKALDACIQDFERFPVPPAPIDSTDPTRKAKRAAKQPNDKNDLDEEEDSDQDTTFQQRDGAAYHLKLGHRLRFGDEDVSELEWRRFGKMIQSITTDSGERLTMSDFMDRSVSSHKASIDPRATVDVVKTPTVECKICSHPIDLTAHLDYSLCPKPHHQSRPMTEPLKAMQAHYDRSCTAAFHLTCLADSFLQQQTPGAVGPESLGVLPTHGHCPDPHCSANDTPEDMAFWSDVVRAAYRRSERFERLLQHLVKTGRTLDEELAFVNEPKSPSKTKRKDTQEKATKAVKATKTAKTAGARKKKTATDPVSIETEKAGSESQHFIDLT